MKKVFLNINGQKIVFNRETLQGFFLILFIYPQRVGTADCPAAGDQEPVQELPPDLRGRQGEQPLPPPTAGYVQP